MGRGKREKFGQVLMSDLRRVFGDRLIPCTMGANASQLEKDIGSDLFPANEHFFGLVNFGNTCYSNSVLQALYFCKPFREKVLEYKAKNKKGKNLLGSVTFFKAFLPVKPDV